MSEYADKHSKASRKERVDRILQVDPKAKIDASGYEPPGPMDTGKKTEQAQKIPTRKSGGRLEGKAAHKHAGRKGRDAGGSTVQQLRPQVPTGGLYGEGFSPTHAGMISTAAGLKKGGTAKKRATGGEVQRKNGTSRAEWRKEKENSDIAGRPDALPKSNPVMATTGTRETGGRQPRADGGRTKGKTNITIIVGGPKEQPPAGPGMVPPPPSAMPPKPPLPPAAMGGPAAPPGMPPGMPPQMPPGMGPK